MTPPTAIKDKVAWLRPAIAVCFEHHKFEHHAHIERRERAEWTALACIEAMIVTIRVVRL